MRGEGLEQWGALAVQPPSGRHPSWHPAKNPAITLHNIKEVYFMDTGIENGPATLVWDYHEASLRELALHARLERQPEDKDLRAAVQRCAKERERIQEKIEKFFE